MFTTFSQSSELSKLRAEMKKKVQRSDGPFFSTLEKRLNELNVERQAYQGGIFVGNHVHKLLKVSCNSSIYACSSLLCLSDSPVVLMFSRGTLAKLHRSTLVFRIRQSWSRSNLLAFYNCFLNATMPTTPLCT